MKKITVFCSASFDIDPIYNTVAREFVRKAVSLGYGIVSGGTVKGTMGEIADEVNRCGGFHRGVIPRFMESLVYPEMNEVIWTDTMAERKDLLRKDVYAVVALPGGVGTLDELIDTLALIHLNQYSGKMFVLDHEGFYQPLKQLLEHYVRTGMLKKETYDVVKFASTPDQLLDMLSE